MKFTLLALAFVTAFTKVLAVSKVQRSGAALEDGECEVSADNPAPGVCNYEPEGDEGITLQVPCDPAQPCQNTGNICLYDDSDDDAACS